MQKSLVGYDYNRPRGYKITCLVSAEDTELPFHFITFGRSYKEVNVNWPGVDKGFLIYSEKGRGKAFVNGEWKEMPEGSLAYWPNGAPVRYEPIDESSWQVSFFTFAGRNVESLLGINECFVCSEDLSFVPKLLDELTQKHDKPDWQEFSVSALCYLLMKLRASTRDIAKSGRKVTVSRQIQQSVKYVNEHATDDLSVAELAENCGISEEYYCRMFKKFTGATPTGYINSLRISKACDLLHKYPDRKIEEIGLECGFNNITYFNKIFKRETGASPSEFKANRKK